MASRGRRKSVGVVEMATLAYSAVAAEYARLLSALDAREVGTRPPAAGPHFVPAQLSVAGSTGPPPVRVA